jgi:hypothetical protein
MRYAVDQSKRYPLEQYSREEDFDHLCVFYGLDTVEAIESEIEAAWKNLHHNAKLNDWPDFVNPEEQESFWHCLGDEVSYLCNDISEFIEEKWNRKLTFYQYGRGGATIAPSEWMAPTGGGGFGSFNWETTYCEEPEQLIEIAEILKYVRSYWEDQAQCAKEWWEDMKVANNWDFQELDEEQ